ncbi:hypothetical protein Pcinc_043592 [Petrolisthes cinctipes]|uniref:5'-nucleotidase n=1 Tax=Petrolisthes cinctipes TaxID=88211 RepID=A0AAE1BFM4_PETCI|nr:hypothetical protein Pcinc_043592 [Petrolisthes cinctipes]
MCGCQPRRRGGAQHEGSLPKVRGTREGGRKIGVIGYLTTETQMISKSGRLKIKDEVTAVREEAQRLKQEEGVNIIIAVGHAGYTKDKTIAEMVEEVDVVVGGHTNTFLYNGEDPSTEVSVDSYPTVITQHTGKKVPVVQAYAFGKYLGKLVVTFDERGEVTEWEGNPIILDNTIEQDPDILKELAVWKAQLDSHIQNVIGRTYVFLDGDRFSCRQRECNLGNFNTDAIVHVNAKYPDDLRWAHTSLAVLNGGGIRASIDERASNGTITMEDVMTMAPFQGTIDIVELKGKHVKEMFEHSVYDYDPKGIELKGGFLQVSGFEVVYDINLDRGSRVVRLQARCQKCRIPEMRDIEEDEVYRIAMPSFLALGGDGYTVIRDKKVNHHLTGLLDTDAYTEYIRQTSPIHHGTENRIRFVDTRNLCSDDAIQALGNTYTTYTTNPHNNNNNKKNNGGGGGGVGGSDSSEEDDDGGDSGSDGGSGKEVPGRKRTGKGKWEEPYAVLVTKDGRGDGGVRKNRTGKGKWEEPYAVHVTNDGRGDGGVRKRFTETFKQRQINESLRC